MDPINFEPANNMKTPAHIYPEWYFLWSYEVLRGFFFDVGGDFLLIYRIEPLSKFEMVVFVRTGTHSELFK
jgi:quinol-cytochrome oxidoreductase complex cytochrome b subunit